MAGGDDIARPRLLGPLSHMEPGWHARPHAPSPPPSGTPPPRPSPPPLPLPQPSPQPSPSTTITIHNHHHPQPRPASRTHAAHAAAPAHCAVVPVQPARRPQPAARRPPLLGHALATWLDQKRPVVIVAVSQGTKPPPPLGAPME
ncbi:uncharacterized protein SETTUDRAFT_38838 [Exserohilum turcica Et28A]|uniref:Uncharacterized protein n=1 Tax=Exserohilum turcicum (strain 28A) TaxID=671987 RepID=R0IU80_EXST2|nr:uncharacterized protein SETTUDRAFT_38838 [Exserohilum turcica Et28A]EOA88161.1 hypothetical protein SETTUDRAFT_38838 [Exserohilum turcica Et28A]